MCVGEQWKDPQEDIWEIVAIHSTSNSCDVVKVHGPTAIKVGHHYAGLSYSALQQVGTNVTPLQNITVGAFAELWREKIAAYIMPTPHRCAMVVYDTGLPNSRRFKYCKECDKEESI